ncbi:MAG: ferritin family protein [Myxococcota bacterium]|jgi:rubrerythrin|nr:ferritin family protein [Myxococcota bacterium]
MDESTKTMLVDAVKQALMVELKGQQLYSHAADQAKDATAKMLFRDLANDENEHMRVLQAQYRSLLADGKVDVAALHPAEVDHAASRIVTDEFRKSLAQGTFELAVVSIGCDLERRAILFYEEQAQRAEIAELKALFQALAKWEKGHLEALSELEKLMQDEYWSRQGFAPF